MKHFYKICIFFTSLSFLLILYFSYGWYYKSFGDNLTVQQILAHSKTEYCLIDKGIKTSYLNLVRRSFLTSLLVTITLVLLYAIEAKGWSKRFFAIKLNILSIIRNLTLCNAFLCLVIILLFLYKVEGYSCFLNSFNKDKFFKSYVEYKKADDEIVLKKKNLILIYVESLESDFSNVNNMNYIPHLTSLEGQFVSKLKQAPGTNWSMAGMLSSQCAIPYSIASWNSSIRPKDNVQNSYSLPSIICLGDILNQYGYKQVFLVGCPASFDGMYDFYNTHHYDSIIGIEQLKLSKNHGHNYTSWNEGLSDDDLFQEAYTLIKKMSSEKGQYNLTLITMDSHGPDGFPSPQCSKKNDKPSLYDVYSCVDKSVTNFINRLKSEQMLKDTVVVIMGDHLLMIDGEIRRNMGLDNKNVFFKIVGDNLPEKYRNYMTHFDVLPTILNLLGYRKVGKTDLGFGKSIYNEESEEMYENHIKKVTDEYIINFISALHKN